MHRFSYPAIIRYKGKRVTHVKKEFIHGWCHLLQYRLVKELHGAEPYEIWEKTMETNNEFWNDHQIVKYKGFFIDVSGIFTEEQMMFKHRLLSRKINKDMEMKILPCEIISDDEYNEYVGLPTHCCDVVVKIMIDDIISMCP